jgi:hypothetical protein
MLALATEKTKKEERPLILAARNAHKAFLYACALLDLDVEWIFPLEKSSHLCSCVLTPEEVEKVYGSEEKVLKEIQELTGYATIDAYLEAEIAKKLAWMGVEIDPELNAIRSDEVRTISTPESKIRVLVVPTNEEYMIALDVAELLG